MSDTNEIIDALYDNFLLRDIFAKMLPGAIALTGILFRASFGKNIIEFASQIGWPAILLLSGLAWIVGFAVQDVGEISNIIRHHPRGYDNSDYRYRRRIAFKQVATISETKQYERYAIIKEASGNCSTAMFLAAVILAVRVFIMGDMLFEQSIFIAGIFFLLTGITLFHINRTHGQKQYNFLDMVIEVNGK